MKEFILNNNVVGTTAGVCVALFTKGLITSLVNDVVTPALQYLFIKSKLTFLMRLFPKKMHFNIGVFFQEATGWLIGIIVTFFFISFSFKYLFGIDGVKKKSISLSTSESSSKTNNSLSKHDELSNTNTNTVMQESFSPSPYY
jgi:large-conductance mechanosensitive channel